MDEENTLLWKQRIQNCLESNLPVRTWCNQNHISPPTFYYRKKKLSKDISSVEEITPVFTEVNSGVATEELQQPTSLQISWNQMHFNIATKKEAQLAAYFVHQLQSLC